jgi:predicted ATP-dependent serine protease
MVEHVVDVVLVLVKQANGSRVLQVTKNRLGPASMALPLRMTPSGLLPSQSNPKTSANVTKATISPDW